MIDRTSILGTGTAVLVVVVAMLHRLAIEAAEISSPPNIVIFLADDNG